jgi:nucleoid DNA-binding protein
LDITAFIRELLFGHDCVIIPGFGGFIGNYSPAYIDKSAGTFYPPVKQISFNRNLNHNDGLLIARISEAEKINYGAARQKVEEYVSEMRGKLAAGEKVVLDKIGSFVNNREGNVQFEPDREANYLLDSYGLTSFRCQPLENYDVRKRVIGNIGKEPVRQIFTQKNIRRAAVILPLALALIIIPLKTDFFKPGVEKSSINPLVTAEFENNKKAILEEHKDIAPEENKLTGIENSVKEENTAVENMSPPSTEPVPDELTGPPSTGDFYVITGSFKSHENAVSQAGMLKAQGFVPEIHDAPNGFYRVCAIKCKDMPTALTKKDSISKKFPGVWIKKIQ